MSGFTNEEFSQAKQKDLNTTQAITAQTEAKVNLDAGAMVITLLDWITYFAGEGKQPHFTMPEPGKTQYTSKKGGKGTIYRLSFRGLANNLRPSKIFEEVRDEETGELLHYLVECSVTYSKENGRGQEDAHEYVASMISSARNGEFEMGLKQRTDILSLVGDNGDLVHKTWVKVGLNQLVECSLSVFSKNLINALKVKDSTGNPSIRRGSLVSLGDVNPNIKVDVWVKTDEDNPDNRTWNLKINEPSFRCNRMTPYTSENSLNLVDTLREMANRTPQFAIPVLKLLDGSADDDIPNSVIYQATSKILYGNTVMRNFLTKRVMSQDDFIVSTSGELKNTWLLVDRYELEDKTRLKFNMRFSIWAKMCYLFGLDPTYWFNIMNANRDIDMLIVASYLKPKTLNLDCNSETALLNKSEEDADGTFCFSITSVFPLYEEWFESGNGFKLKLEDIEEIFPEAFSANGTVGFKSILDEPNPLHIDGAQSKVICLGSRDRHTFDCDDATDMITNPETKFFALAGKENLGEDKSIFLSLAKINGGLQYQVFAIQNIKRKTSKK